MAILGPDGKQVSVLPSMEIRYQTAQHKLGQLNAMICREKGQISTLMTDLDTVRSELRALTLILLNKLCIPGADFNAVVVQCMEEASGALSDQVDKLLEARVEARGNASNTPV